MNHSWITCALAVCLLCLACDKIPDSGKARTETAKPAPAISDREYIKDAWNMLQDGNYYTAKIRLSDFSQKFPTSPYQHIVDSLIHECDLQEDAAEIEYKGIDLKVLRAGWGFNGLRIVPEIEVEVKNITRSRNIRYVLIRTSFLNTHTKAVFGTAGEKFIPSAGGSGLKPGYSARDVIMSFDGFEPHRSPDELPDLVADMEISIEGESNFHRSLNQQVAIPKLRLKDKNK